MAREYAFWHLIRLAGPGLCTVLNLYPLQFTGLILSKMPNDECLMHYNVTSATNVFGIRSFGLTPLPWAFNGELLLDFPHWCVYNSDSETTNDSQHMNRNDWMITVLLRKFMPSIHAYRTNTRAHFSSIQRLPCMAFSLINKLFENRMHISWKPDG